LSPRTFRGSRSLADQAAEHIRRHIVKGDYQLGEALSETTLAAQLGVSKTPVREAFLRLETEGLVDIQPQRGTFVDHVIDLRLFAASRNPTGLSHTDAPPTDRDSDIVRSVLSDRAPGLDALCACEGRDVTASEARSYNRDQPHGSRMQNRLAAQYAVDTRAVHRLLREASIEQVEWLSPNELGQRFLRTKKSFSAAASLAANFVRLGAPCDFCP
jgi:DNA-binding transcriptional MocR family regulator